MTGESISFAELFEQQAKEARGLRVTAQPIADDSERVKITPVDSDGNCWCSSSLVIPVASVSALRATEDTATCCGKRLKVVEIEFSDAALTAVVSQVHARAAAIAQAAAAAPRDYQPGPGLPAPYSPYSPPWYPGSPYYPGRGPAARSRHSLGESSTWSCATQYAICMTIIGDSIPGVQTCGDAYYDCMASFTSAEAGPGRF